MADLTKYQQNLKTIQNWLTSDKMKTQLAMALPKHLPVEKIIRTVISAINRAPELANCTVPSILSATMESALLGLPPNGALGHGYFVPYKNKKTGNLEATFIPGYRGLIDLARRSGHVESIQARCVYENDEFDFCYGADAFIEHKPAQMIGKDPGKFRAAYCVAKLSGGEVVFEVMFHDQIEAIRKRSRAGETGAWVTDTDEMRRKTAVRRIMKYLPLSVDVQQAVMRDEYQERGIDLGPIDPVIDVESSPEEEPPVLPSTLDTIAEELDDDETPRPKGPITKKETEEFKELASSLLKRGISALNKANYESPGEVIHETITAILDDLNAETIDALTTRDSRGEYIARLMAQLAEWESESEDSDE